MDRRFPEPKSPRQRSGAHQCLASASSYGDLPVPGGSALQAVNEAVRQELDSVMLGNSLQRSATKLSAFQVARRAVGAVDYPMGQGDIEWTRVREELARISFHGWTTAEVRGGDRRRLAAISAEMNTILGL